jgi:nitrogen-specific signal transduction histidine kinase
MIDCEPPNLVAATVDIAEAINRVAKSLHELGTADAVTPMGAIELLALEVKNGLGAIAGAITHLADTIQENGKRD